MISTKFCLIQKHIFPKAYIDDFILIYILLKM